MMAHDELNVYDVAIVNGPPETITAKNVRVASGCLLFGDGTGWVKVFAAGTWLTLTKVSGPDDDSTAQKGGA
jgi:hypothetical protein